MAPIEISIGLGLGSEVEETIQVEPGQKEVIPNIGDGDDLGIIVSCNDRDDGGNIQVGIFRRKIEEMWWGIEISHELQRLEHQLETEGSLTIGVNRKAIARIQHIPRTPGGRWDSLRRRIGI